MRESYWSKIWTRRIRRRRALVLTGGTAFGAALLAACGADKGGEGDKSGLVTRPSDTFKQAKRGGVLKDFSPTDATSFDDLTPGGGSGASECYATLVLTKPGYLKPSGSEMSPYMAASWEWSPDGLQITMKLREGVKFHNKPPVNGRILDMDDVLFSWNRFAAKSSNRSDLVNAVNPGAPVLSLTAVDPTTIVIKQKQPLAETLEYFGHFSGGGNVNLVPKEADTSFDSRKDVIGTGPIFLSNYMPSVGFTFKRHAEFYDADFILFDQRDKPIVPEYAAQLAQFKTGNIHYLGSGTSSYVRPEDVLPVKREEPRLLIYPTDVEVSTGSSGLSFGWLPEGKSPFLDERVRQAVSMSYDRDLFIETFYNVSNFEAAGMPVETRWHTHFFASNEGWWLDPKGKDFGPNAKYFQHDLAEAKKLMAAAGYGDGLAVTSHAPQPGGPQGDISKYALVTDNMTSDIGIKLTTDYGDYTKQYIPLWRDGHGQYEGWAHTSLAGGPVSGGNPLRHLASQYLPTGGALFKGFSTSGKNDQSGDPHLSALIEKARLEQDTQRQHALAFDIQRYLAKAMWALRQPGAASRFTMAWPTLGNYRVWRGNGAALYYRWWLDQTKPPFTKA